MNSKNKKTIAIVLSIFAIVAVIGATYAFVTRTLTGTKKVTLTAGTLSLVLDEKNEITISDALPMYDQVGMIQEEVFEFDLINNTSNPTDYTLKLQKVSTTNELSTSDVKYYLTKDGVGTPALLSTLTDGVVDTGTIEGNDRVEYTLRMWISDTVTSNEAISGKSLSYRIDVEASMAEGDTSCPVLAETEPNAPQLTSGMIAVTYNETDKTWVKADTSNNNWYDYDNQIWANAVTVTKDTRDTYMAMDSGEPISIDDINTMWVWIPRYSYTIMQPYGRSDTKCSDLGEITIDSPSNCRKVEYPSELRAEALALCKDWYPDVTTEEDCIEANEYDGYYYNSFEEFIDIEGIELGGFEDTRTLVETYPDNYISSQNQELPGAIDIKFISTREKDTGTGQCENCAENWVTPEGFTFGNEEISGFWMGKFETSTLESCEASTFNPINTDCDVTTLTPQIKPNVTSWRLARVSTFFEASRLMQSSDNASIYGFDVAGVSSMDTHMSKNTEWGIVAMLSQSRYGKYGNPTYSGVDKEVAVNDNSSYITGIGGDTVISEKSLTVFTTNTYETKKGRAASTTGTIYGVYDMRGGAYEYVMGNFQNYSGGGDYNIDSGFCGNYGPTNCREWPEAKYVDIYNFDFEDSYKFGDATYETMGWYDNYYAFVSGGWPWFLRGNYYNNNDHDSGVFSYSKDTGTIDENNASRFVIKP